jgi:hypothetical protein
MTTNKTPFPARTYDLPTKQDPPRSVRRSISVSGAIYDRLRASVIGESLAAFVDDVVTSALDDPVIAARIAARCRRETGP